MTPPEGTHEEVVRARTMAEAIARAKREAEKAGVPIGPVLEARGDAILPLNRRGRAWRVRFQTV